MGQPRYTQAPVHMATQALTSAGKASTSGSWQVVGNSGALAVHAQPTTSDTVLFMQRPNNRNGSGNDPYLTVCPIRWPN